MKRIYISLLYLLITSFSFAQYGPRISGKVLDGQSNNPLPGAVAVLKSLSDSTIEATSTNGDGVYEFKKMIRPGDYKIVFSFMGYENLEQKITLVPRQPLKVDPVRLSTQAKDIKEVVIKDNVAMVKVNSDTTEFNAAAYKTQKNAVAEDLIKKMPGMEVDDQGKVKSQGQEVQRVLVDGKQFFGDDPSMALRNLPAEIIDKVQMVDDMNEQAKFTGFDDNERIKTMNIVTRKDKRAGYFGKVSAGYGENDRYSTSGNLSYFKGNTRISLIGSANNTNEMNFSMMDMFGGGGGGRGMRGGGGGSFFGSSGLTKIASAGLNYSDVWGKKTKVTASYFVNQTKNNNDQFINREYILASTQLFDQHNISTNNNLNHRFNMRLEFFMDSMNYLMLRPNFSIQDNSQVNNLNNATSLADANRINSSIQGYNSTNKGYSIENEIQYNHRFAKLRRTFSINANYSTNPREGNSYFNSIDTFYTKNGIFDYKNISDRYTPSPSSGYVVSSNFAYTEPISQNTILQLNYFIRSNKSSIDTKVYDYNLDDLLYNKRIDSLSNTSDSWYNTQRLGLSLMRKIKTAILTLGSNVQQAALDNSRIYPKETSLNRNFKNVLPYASLSWKSGRKASLNFNLTTTTRSPGISQLADVLDNKDRTRQSKGNPELKPEYSGNMMTRFSFVHPQSTRTIMFIFNGSYVTDRIANSTIIAAKDTTLASENVKLGRGAQFTKPYNVNDPYYYVRSFVTAGTPILKKKINININSGVSFVSDPGYINGAVNISKTFSYNEGLVISSNISPVIDFTLSGNLNLNKVKNSLQTNLDRNYSSQRYSFRFNYVLLKAITFSSNVTYMVNLGLGEGYNVDYTMWNGSVGYQFLKSKNAEIKFSVSDILQQNVSVSRNITQSYIEDVRNLVLTRYIMITLVYNIRSFGMSQNMMNPDGERRRREFGRPDHMH